MVASWPRVRDFIVRLRYQLLLLSLVAFFSYALRDAWRQPGLSIASKFVLTGAFLALVAVTTYERSGVLRAGEAVRDFDTERRSFDLELEKLNSELTERGLLLKNVAEEVSYLLESLRKRISRACLHEVSAQDKEDFVSEALRGVCSVFERFRAGAGDGRLESTFFKATFFEARANPSGGKLLVRAGYHYPPTRAPQTAQIDVDSAATAARSFRTGQLIVLEDIPSEVNSPDPRFVNLRADQAREYKAMICVPVMWREVGEELRKIGVITVDTNRSKYFRDTPEDQEFLNQVLAPFLSVIHLWYRALLAIEGTRATGSSPA